jgi:transcriptional regulator with XRE-family HTH domain
MEQGEILKQLRKQKNLTQKQLATFLCISKSAYGYYEQGKNQMDYKTLVKLSDFFNVPIDYLIKGSFDNMLSLNDAEYEHIKILRSLSEKNKGQIIGFAKGISQTDNMKNL